MPKTKASFCVIAATLCTVIVLFVLPITPKIPVSIATIQRGTLVRTQSMEGLVCYGNEQPCVSPVAGQIAQVYVRQGQSVQQGDALLRLDTSLEERTLSELKQTLHQQEEAISALPAGQEVVQAVWLQNQLTLEQKIQEIGLTIEAKTLRATTDGVVGQVYAGQDAYVAALSPLMSIHAETVEICAQQRVQDSASLEVGMQGIVYVNGKQQAVVTLKAFEAPYIDEVSGMYSQTLRFSLAESDDWFLERVGETVAIELLWDIETDVALAPISAVSQSDFLWIMEDGKASAVAIDPQKRDASYVCVPEELVGATVILLPDDSQLYSGCLVKEAKK